MSSKYILSEAVMKVCQAQNIDAEAFMKAAEEENLKCHGAAILFRWGKYKGRSVTDVAQMDMPYLQFIAKQEWIVDFEEVYTWMKESGLFGL